MLNCTGNCSFYCGIIRNDFQLILVDFVSALMLPIRRFSRAQWTRQLGSFLSLGNMLYVKIMLIMVLGRWPSDLEHLQKRENLCSEVEEMVQWLRTRTTPADDLSLVPCTHITQLPTASDCCYTDSNQYRFLASKSNQTHSYTLTCRHMHKIKTKIVTEDNVSSNP